MARRNRRAKTGKAQAEESRSEESIYLTAEDILEHSRDYFLARVIATGALGAGIICLSVALVLRISTGDLHVLALILEVLTYVLVGGAALLWFFRLRSFRKQAEVAASEHNAKQESFSGKSGSENYKNAENSECPEPRALFGIRYSILWRGLLILGAALMISAYISLHVFGNADKVTLILLAAAYVPITLAFFIYNRFLKQ